MRPSQPSLAAFIAIGGKRVRVEVGKATLEERQTLVPIGQAPTVGAGPC